MTSQHPPGPSNADIAAWPSKKLSVRRSTTRFAVCSLPMANVARWVLGVEGIEGPGKWRNGRSVQRLSISDARAVRWRPGLKFPLLDGQTPAAIHATIGKTRG